MDGMAFDLVYDSVQGNVNKRKCVIETTNVYKLELGVAFARKDPQKNSIKDRSLSVGKESVEENTADGGGLRVAFNAYQKKEPNYEKLVNLPKYDHKKLFFLAFANVWCSSESVQYTEETILRTEEKKNGKHSPSKFRVNESLKNMKEFADVWGCRPGTKMNPNPKSRCTVW
ncbi:neprilysin-3-like [Cloeon dipterum]|uniref:neprilysin-3-like n=1 Tax=Cloeon dipterum TaxID=197152 RepID=UPI0032208B8C